MPLANHLLAQSSDPKDGRTRSKCRYFVETVATRFGKNSAGALVSKGKSNSSVDHPGTRARSTSVFCAKFEASKTPQVHNHGWLGPFRLGSCTSRVWPRKKERNANVNKMSHAFCMRLCPCNCLYRFLGFRIVRKGLAPCL